MEPKTADPLHAIHGEAAMLRGIIITSYAQVEHLLADILVRCQLLTAYATLPASLPYRFETRVARVRKIVAMPGPLARYKDEFEQVITELQRFEEIRHFMAHGLLVVNISKYNCPELKYRMYRERKEGVEEGLMVTNLTQLHNAALEIARHSQRTVTLFHKVYHRHKLKAR